MDRVKKKTHQFEFSEAQLNRMRADKREGVPLLILAQRFNISVTTLNKITKGVRSGRSRCPIPPKATCESKVSA